MWPSQRSFPAGIAVSVAIHLVPALGLMWRADAMQPPPPPTLDTIDVDIEEAPVPPVAKPLPPERIAAVAVADATTAQAKTAVPVSPPPLPVEADDAAETAVVGAVQEERDAAVPEELDAAVPEELDAAVPEPLSHQAQGLDGGAGEVAATIVDSGVGTAVAAAIIESPVGAELTGDDGGVLGASSSTATTEAAAFAAANLLSYFPPEQFPSEQPLAVLLRFDRLRGTEWAAAAEALLQPLPDYEIFIGKRDVALSDLFESITIASTDPNDVIATTLVGHSARRPDEIRELLDHPGAPVKWIAARGGALGKRKRAKRMSPADSRVFLTPFPGWFVLTLPEHLGNLLEPGIGSLDAARASSADLPDWLARVRAIEMEAGKDAGPALMLTAAGLIDEINLPGIFEAPAPDQLTMALDIDPKGFLVRGSLTFASAEQAKVFLDAAARFQSTFADSRLGQALLRKFYVYNVVAGLTLAQTEARLSYATSISVADARVILAHGAEFLAQRYADKRAEMKSAAKARAARKAAKAGETAADKKPIPGDARDPPSERPSP